MEATINIITAICLALLTLEVVYVIINIAVKKRPERIAFVRSFKKGKCLAIFLIAIPLFFLGYWYSGINIFESILASIHHVFGLVVLNFGLDDIPGLLSANGFYSATVYYCCVLVTINAALFTISFIGQNIWQWAQSVRIRLTSKDKLYILGCNQNSLSIYKSGKEYVGIVADDISKDDRSSLYISKIGYIPCREFDKIISDIFIGISKKNGKIVVVINTEDDERNIKLGHSFIDRIKAADGAMREQLFDKLSVHIFGDPRYEAVYEKIVDDSFGCVHYKNKYRMIAMNFIDKYPLSRFMDERHIDYSTALLKSDVDVNVCMIGFGKPNQQIFLTSVANNQFLTQAGSGVKLKQVNYHVFDKAYAENNKCLNHSYYRFRNECVGLGADEYLPLPELPAHEEYHHMDVNEPDFYNKIREVVSAKNKKDVNFIIVSFESDLENIDMAQKLVEKSGEWGVEDLTVFVRVKSPCEYKSLFSDKSVFLIGNEEECVYNISEITADKIFKMAQMRNEIYELEKLVKDKASDKDFVMNESVFDDNRRQANKKWFTEKCRLERESNLYCCLSLRSKLNLMGLDYCEKDGNASSIDEREYLKIYAGDDMPDTETYGLEADGKKVIKYGLDFPQSKRKNLAVLEHLRWNSFMISQGVIPASKERILNEKNPNGKNTDGKNYGLRRHGNLTTFDGLVTFRRMLAERDGGDEIDKDVIKYDYQLLDDAYWLLTKNEYKIVERNQDAGK